MYYILTNCWPAEYGYEDLREIRPLSVPGDNSCLGIPMPQTYPEITYVVGDIKSLPPFFKASVHLLMNQTAIEALERSGETHFELHSVRIVDIRRREDRISYQRVHPLDHVTCLDRNRSDFDIDRWSQTEQRIDHIRHLVLDESRIPTDRHLFSMMEFPVDIISERLRDCFLGVGFPSVIFQPVDEYDSEKPYLPEN